MFKDAASDAGARIPAHPEQSRGDPAAPRRRPPRPASRSISSPRRRRPSPDDPDLLFNLGYAYALDRDPRGRSTGCARRCAAIRRTPTRTSSSPRRSTRRAARSRPAASASWPRSCRPLPRTPRRRAGEALPRGLERVRQHLESMRGSGIDQAIANTAQRDQRDLAQFHLERARRLFEGEQDREAMTELRRAVFLSPYEAEAHLLIGRIHLRAGRPREAVDALKISIWSRDTAAAHVALADAYLRLKDLPGGAGRKSRRRWRSIRRRPTPSACSSRIEAAEASDDAADDGHCADATLDRSGCRLRRRVPDPGRGARRPRGAPTARRSSIPPTVDGIIHPVSCRVHARARSRRPTPRARR